ncbi:uroporphyrinogen-III synthase [Micrococcus luteus]|uniref:uroporphyrinogen-III synthase n=1 Tax=Micrococcus luteus TaxID=1270 RepID=UPI00214FA90D|nr:uroporphyrinogen-III synthase [Micrococcus luteus]MCR4489879.1 uroporphyrinogen-III synthase [Micrococcus luteus]
MRVLLTRQPAQAGDLEAGLAGTEVAGRRLRVGFLPLTDFALPDDDGPLRALLADWAGADGDAAGPVRSDGSRWLVVTSPNTVRALRAVGWDGHVPAGARIAVTGPGTARVLTEAGCDAAPWLPPEDRSAEGLIAGLAALHPRGARAWLPQSDRARSRLAPGLRAAGWDLRTGLA